MARQMNKQRKRQTEPKYFYIETAVEKHNSLHHHQQLSKYSFCECSIINYVHNSLICSTQISHEEPIIKSTEIF